MLETEGVAALCASEFDTVSILCSQRLQEPWELMQCRSRRAAAIALDKRSSDLCDDHERMELGRGLGLAVTEDRFGYPKVSEEGEEKSVGCAEV